MNRTLWIHQFDQWQAEYGATPIAPVIATQGFTRVCVKALDGANWMNQFDTSSDAISGIPALQSWLASFNRHGLAMDVWVVPTKDTARGMEPIYAALLSELPGRLILDLEPYAGFWGDQSSVDFFLGEFIDSLYHQTGFANVAAPWARLGVTYDPRRTGWLDIWYNRFAVHLPQVYDVAWMASVQPRGKPMEVMLSTAQQAQDWWTICRDATLGSEDGRTGFGIFRGPVVGTAYLGTLRGLT